MQLALFSLRGERSGRKKVFFAKRTHFQTSDIQLTYCDKRRYKIYKGSGIGFVIGFVLQSKAIHRGS